MGHTPSRPTASRGEAALAVAPVGPVEGNSRLAQRVGAEDKATLMRAVALAHTDMTDFILRHVLDAARKVIDQAEHVILSERDSLRVFDALEHAPVANAKLLGVARRMPKRK